MDNPIELHHVVTGRGAPLYLLHGFSGSSADWEPLVPSLARDHQVIAVDARGHGRSPNPSRELRHQTLARDLLALADRLGHARFSAIGVSMGGNTLLHAATLEPARVAAMVLAPATPWFPAAARPLFHAAAEAHAAGADERARELWRHVRVWADGHDDMDFTPPRLATIRARTLVVSGDRDPLYGVDMALTLFRAIPGAALAIVDDCGHDPVFGPQRERFLAMVLPFLVRAHSAADGDSLASPRQPGGSR